MALPATGLSDEQADLSNSLQTIEAVLTRALVPTQGLTPLQLQDLMEMFITDMHLRKMIPEFWLPNLTLVARVIALASQVDAETKLLQVPNLPAEAQAILKGSIDISFKEISDARKKLLELLATLKECPLPGQAIH